MITEIDWLSERKEKKAVVLSETRHRARSLELALSETHPHWEFLTLSEVYRRLFSQLAPDSDILVVSSLEINLLLAELVFKEEKFSSLKSALGLDARPIEEGEPTARLNRGVGELIRKIDPVRRFIESYRLELREEFLLNEITDEYGAVASDRERLGELVELIGFFTEELTAKRIIDRVGRQELVLSRLDALPKELLSKQLPDLLVLDQPTHIFPLQHAIWERICKVSKVALLLDEEAVSAEQKTTTILPPSLRQIRSVLKLARTVRNSGGEIVPLAAYSKSRQALVDRVIDADSTKEIPDSGNTGVAVWRCVDRREEARRIARAVGYAYEQGRIIPEEIHIALPQVDPYRALLDEQFAEVGLQASFSKGIPFFQTLYGGLFRALLKWLEEPSLINFFSLASHPGAAATSILKSQRADFCTRWGIELPECVPGLESESDSEKATEQVNIGLFIRWAESCGVPNLNGTFAGWVDYPIAFIRKGIASGKSARSDGSLTWGAIVGVLALLEQECLVREEIYRAESSAVLQLVTGAFRRWRKRLRKLRKEPLDVEQTSSTTAIDEVQNFDRRTPATRDQLGLDQLVRENLTALKESRDRIRGLKGIVASYQALPLADVGEESQNVKEDLTEREERIAEILLLLNRVLDEQSIVVSPPKSGQGSEEEENKKILVTELLDLRGVRGRVHFVMGLTAEEFPAQSENPLLADFASGAAVRLLRRSGAGEATAESIWLLSHLLRASKELVITFPSITEGKEVPKPAALLTLEQLLSEKQTSNLLQSPPANWRAEGVEELGSDISLNYSLVQARSATISSVYDGDFSGEQQRWEQVASGMFPEEGRQYSTSELELLGDCHHRYFFRSVLELRDERLTFDGLLGIETGRVVHHVLEILSRDGWLDKEKLRGRWNEGLKAALSSTNLAAAKSVIPWEVSPVTRGLLRNIVEGLETNDLAPKWGVLKAALLIERELMNSIPWLSEWRFSDTRKNAGNRSIEQGAPALVIENGVQRVRVSGVIDRVDKISLEGAAEGTAVWDFKTGKVPKISDVKNGKSLQVPLYALAVKQHLPPNQLPLRGGIVSLNKPNAREEGSDIPEGKAVVELLAYSRAKSIDEVKRGEIVAEVAENATQKVLTLDREVRAGLFAQNIETEGCEYCEFRRICARDDVSLAERAGNNGEKRDGAFATEDFLSATPEATPIVERSDETNLHEANGVKEGNSKAPVQLPLTREQEQAAAVDRDIVLIAGAGSGKTHVLRTRVLRLLLAGEPVESIVAITFTEKAANEIRERIERTIIDALQLGTWEGMVLSEPERALLVNARFGLRAAPIGTIHSLAWRIVRRDPEAAGLDFEPTLATEGLMAELRARAVDEVVYTSAVDSELGLDVETILASGVSRFTLCNQLKNFLKSRKDRLAIREMSELAPELFRKEVLARLEQIRCERLQVFKAELACFVTEWLREVWDWLEVGSKLIKFSDDARARFEEAVGLAIGLVKELKFDEKAPEPGWKKLFFALRSHMLEYRKSAAKNANKKLNQKNFWKELTDFINSRAEKVMLLLPSDGREERAVELVLVFSRVLSAVERRLAGLKKKRRIIDFDGVIAGAYKVLNSPPQRDEGLSFVNRLRGGFRHLMVDEFQDTDSEQWGIVRALALREDEPSKKSRNHPAENSKLPRTLFIVGDPQQSIYSFRGGDLRVFKEAERFIKERGGVVCELSDNYRSKPEVLSFVNEFFSKLFGLDFNSDGRALVGTAVHYREMNPAGSLGVKPQLRVHFKDWKAADLETAGDEEKDKIQNIVSEADKVAEYVEELLANDAARAESEQGTSGISVVESDKNEILVAILTRSGKHVETISEALSRKDILHTVAHGGGFFTLPEILAVENLLRLVADNQDEIAAVGVLRSWLGGLSDLDLAELWTARASTWSKIILEEEEISGSVAVKKAIFRLRRWLSQASTLSASQLLETIFKELQPERIFAASRSLDAAKNVRCLAELLRDATARGECMASAISVLNWLKTRAEEGGRIDVGGAVGDDSGRKPRVTVMTIHGSKGLEFPIVVLPYLDVKLGNSDDFVVGELGGEHLLSERFPVVAMKVEDPERSYVRKKTLLQVVIEESHAGLRAAEERRLFYVACTRAEEHLVLFAPARQNNTLADAIVREGEENEAGEETVREGLDLRLRISPLTWLQEL